MPCYKPLKCRQYYSGETMKMRTDFKSKNPNSELPCRRCLGCKLTKAKEWAIRCMHECRYHQESTFVTLTYNNEDLPKGGDLDHSDFQRFMYKLRNHQKENNLPRVRFYMCGEYGEKNKRPHYHAILFGVKFPDEEYLRTRGKNRVYRSATLDRIWGHGRAETGCVSESSAGYVARYTLQKQQEEDLERICPGTGEIYKVRKPYNRSSLKPGLGYKYFEEFKTDIFPDDFVIDEKYNETPTPGYYRVLLQRDNPEMAEDLRQRRIEKAKNNPDNSPERLAQRETCKTAQVKGLEREL